MFAPTLLVSLSCLVSLAFGQTAQQAIPDSRDGTDSTLVSIDFSTKSLSSQTLLACVKAANCETYQTANGTMIRFKAGEEPGSTNYQSRFSSKNATVLQPSGQSGSVDANGPKVFSDNSLHTDVDMSDTKTFYGSTSPFNVMQQLYSPCQISACDPTPFKVDTSSVQNVAQQGSAPTGGQVTVIATGQYDGFDKRDFFIHAIEGVVDNNYQKAEQPWRIHLREDPQHGLLTVYHAAGFVSVSRWQDGAMHGFMTAQVTWDSNESKGWCALVTPDIGAIAAAINPIAGGFFGFLNIFCQR